MVREEGRASTGGGAGGSSHVGNAQPPLQLSNGTGWAGYILCGSTSCAWLQPNSATDVAILPVKCYRGAIGLATCAHSTIQRHAHGESAHHWHGGYGADGLHQPHMLCKLCEACIVVIHRQACYWYGCSASR